MRYTLHRRGARPFHYRGQESVKGGSLEDSLVATRLVVHD